jgi:hypothetical protein
MFNPFGTAEYKKLEADKRKAAELQAAQAKKLADKKKKALRRLKPVTPLPVIIEEPEPLPQRIPTPPTLQ